ncbi:MAG: TolC family protein [Planctomycetota bacterium]
MIRRSNWQYQNSPSSRGSEPPSKHGPRSAAEMWGLLRATRRLLAFAVVALTVASNWGCTRTHYRKRADQQSYEILTEKTNDERWTLPRLDIAPDPRSRFFDPHNLDHPPLPPDDPAAHQYMHRVDGKRGWSGWQDFGRTDRVENPDWPTYLGGPPLNAENPELPQIDQLTLERAIELGLIHSREYQASLEDVYLSALSLTFQRYRFQLRASGLSGEPGADLFYEHQPDNESNLALGPSHFGLRKLFPTGAQLVTELANETVWLFSGSNDTTTSTTFGFLLVQPLLRRAGREVALENLTQSERRVLYSIRRFARFRKEFYVMIVTGERAVPLPGSAGGSELAFLIRGERAPTVGFYYLLMQYQRLRNREENVRSLEMRLRDVRAMRREGTATSLDVTQVQSSLEQARTSLIFRRRFFGDRLDQFKLQLGLPPDLELTLDDSLLAPFQLENRRLSTLESQLRELDDELDAQADTPNRVQLRQTIDWLAERRATLVAEFKNAVDKAHELVESIEQRVIGMSEESAEEFRNNAFEDARQIESLQASFRRQCPEVEDLRARAEQARNVKADLRPILRDVRRRRNLLSRFTRRLNSLEGAVRVELIELVPVSLTSKEAVDVAVENRLDLMNRRALLMDARRRLEVAADELEANLDIVAEGEVNTPPLFGNDKPFNFRADESNLSVGVQIDTPMDRRRERNNFRAAQVAYQRARRNFMAAEDQVKLDVRRHLRRIEAQRELFEIQRRALRLASRELEQALEPDKPEDTNGNGGRQQGLNIPRALENILDAQDELIEAWVEYETARLELYRDMGVMRIDANGIWPQEQQRR